MKSFENKVAAITGAGSGMGRTLALRLAAQKCQVALSDVNEAGLAETARLAAQSGVKVTSKKVDVADRAAVYAWAEEVVQDHGKVNLIFNNAGVALGATVEGMSYEDFEWIVGINFWGVVYGTKAFLPHLKASGDGHIINTSSVFGLAGIPSQSAYNATKFAVRGFTEALRQELELAGAPVSATSVHPGGIKTNIARAARMSSSLRDIGLDDKHGSEKFEKNFITTADNAAKIILNAVRGNKRRVLVGPDAYLIDLMVRLLPSSYQLLTMFFARKSMK
ncbi:SDR family NAD(P)-dependent oxidoreductase [Nevskia soli]|uniref:SDR family NAD(P)-dependent oxidoreductase n=1 Tax=Nevskia soli TaxID=418856 RepID=UPI0004A6FD9E|nr:SDR family oxidoreductase [Nevskia soli]